MAMKLATAFVEIAARQDQFRQQMGTLENDVRGRVGTLQGMLAKLAGAVGVGATLGASIKLAAKAESAEVAFNVMLKDMEKTKALLAELNTFSIVTPFEPAEVRRAGLALLAFKTSAEQIPETLQFLGDAAAGTGANFLEVVAVFNKVKAAGKLTGETFLQFAERGINLQAELTSMLGVTGDQFVKMRERGEISFDKVVAAMQRMTGQGGMFFGAMEKQSQTAAGLWSTVKGNVTALSEALGTALLPIWKAVLGVATGFTAAIMALNDKTDGLVMQTGLLTAALIGLGFAWKRLGGAAGIAGRAMKLALLSTGIGALLILVGGVAAGVITLARYIKKVTTESGVWGATIDKLKVAWERLKEVFSVVMQAIGKVVMQLCESIAGLFGTTFGGAKKTVGEFADTALTKIGDWILNMSEWMLVLVQNWDKGWEVIKASLWVALMVMKDNFMQIPVFWSYAMGLTLRGATEAFLAIVEVIARALIALGEFIIDSFKNTWTAVKNIAEGKDPLSGIESSANQLVDSVSRMGEAFAAGWNVENPFKLWKASPELKAAVADQQRLLGQLAGAKAAIERESADKLAAMKAPAPAVQNIPEMRTNKVVANALAIEGGFSGFTDISRKIQEAALKTNDKDKETNKLLAAGNLNGEAQLAELKKMNEADTGLEVAVP